MIHLIIGSTGAGKTTYANKLAAEHGMVALAIDEWMVTLFGDDKPDDAGFEWYAPRIRRCTDAIFSAANKMHIAGSSCALEIGLTRRADRHAFYDRVRAAALPLQLHVLDVPAEKRWQRVETRNRDQGDSYSLTVTRGMFDFVETMWEPPDAAELAEWNAIVVRE